MLEREVPRLVLLRHLGRPSRSQLVTPALFVMMNTTGLNYYLSVRDPAAAGLPSTAYTCAEVFPVSLSVCPPATVFQMDLLFILCAAVTGLRGAMSSSGGAFRAAEAFVKSFVIDGDSVTFDRTALEGLRVRSSLVPRPCHTRASPNAHISLFPLVPSRRTSSCHPGGACAYFRSGRGCRTGTEPSTAVASPPSWTSSPPWRCSPSPKIRASGTFISFNFRMSNCTDAVFCY